MDKDKHMVVLGSGIAGASISQSLASSHKVTLIVRSTDEGSSFTNQKWKHSGLLYPNQSLARQLWTAHRCMSGTLERPFMMKPQARFLCRSSETLQKMRDRWREWDIRDWGIEVEPLATHEYRNVGLLGATNAVGGFMTPDCIMDFPEMIRNLQYDVIQHGGKVLVNAQVERLIVSGDRIVGVAYRQAGEQIELSCDHCIVTMGAWSAKLLRQHRIELPLVVWKCIVLSYPLELVPCLTVFLDARENPIGPDTALVPFKGTTLAAESLAVETVDADDRTIDPVRQERLITELADCFPGISSFEPQAYPCFKTEYRTTSGVPDVGYHLCDAADTQINGLTVAIPGKASLAFELAAQVRSQIVGTA